MHRVGQGGIKVREWSGGSGNGQGRHQAQGMVKGDIMVRGASRLENGQWGIKVREWLAGSLLVYILGRLINEEEKFVDNFSVRVFIKAVSRDKKSILHVYGTFCIYLVREILFLPAKCLGIVKSDFWS